MRVRDAHATLNGSKEEFTMPSGAVEIIADDGRALFDIRLLADGAIEVSVVGACRHGGDVLEDKILVAPRYSNCVVISRQSEN